MKIFFYFKTNHDIKSYPEIKMGNYQPKSEINLKTKILWKVVLFVMSLFFFAAAYVQHNDPDPYLWMPVYIVPFLANVIFIFYLPCVTIAKFWTLFNALAICHCFYCFLLGFWTILHYSLFTHNERQQDYEFFNGLLLAPSLTKEPNMRMEEAKEILGLCLVISWLAFLYDGNFFKSGHGGVTIGMVLTVLPILAWILVEISENGMNGNCV